MLSLSDERVRLLALLRKRLKKTSKRLLQMEANLEAARNWEADQHLADLLQGSFHLLKRGQTEITLADWMAEGTDKTIPLDPKLTPPAQVALFYKRAKRKKRSIPYLEKEIEQLRLALSHWETLIAQCEEVTTEEELKAVRKEAGIRSSKPTKKAEEPVRLPYRTFHSKSGLPILVGRKDKDNDYLTFRVAKGSDWWLHLHGAPGAHVVIQVPKATDPDEEALLDALQLALYYSTAKGEKGADILITQCKYLTKGNKPGQVQVSKHKIRRIAADEARLQKILRIGLPNLR